MPQYFVAIAVAGWVSTFFLALVFWGMQRIEFGWVHLLCMCAAGFAATHLGRRVSLQKQSLIEQLESFTLDGAACRLESDRDFIYEAVTQLYGGLGQFTDFVRGPLRRQLLQCCSQIPADLLLFLVLPLVAYKAELLLAMWKGGVPGMVGQICVLHNQTLYPFASTEPNMFECYLCKCLTIVGWTTQAQRQATS